MGFSLRIDSQAGRESQKPGNLAPVVELSLKPAVQLPQINEQKADQNQRVQVGLGARPG